MARLDLGNITMYVARCRRKRGKRREPGVVDRRKVNKGTGCRVGRLLGTATRSVSAAAYSRRHATTDRRTEQLTEFIETADQCERRDPSATRRAQCCGPPATGLKDAERRTYPSRGGPNGPGRRSTNNRRRGGNVDRRVCHPVGRAVEDRRQDKRRVREYNPRYRLSRRLKLDRRDNSATRRTEAERELQFPRFSSERRSSQGTRRAGHGRRSSVNRQDRRTSG